MVGPIGGMVGVVGVVVPIGGLVGRLVSGGGGGPVGLVGASVVFGRREGHGGFLVLRGVVGGW